MHTHGLLGLIGTNRGTLHRYAVALDVQPRVLGARGHPYDWSPGACATIYTAWQLSRDVRHGPNGSTAPARRVGIAYDALWSTAPKAAPTWLAYADDTITLEHSASAAWDAAGPLAKTGSVVRIVSLVPLKEALMASPPVHPYVVTFGYTRRLVEAENPSSARTMFEVLVGWPIGTTVGMDEVVVRDATEADLTEFYPLRGRHQLLKEQAALFDL